MFIFGNIGSIINEHFTLIGIIGELLSFGNLKKYAIMQTLNLLSDTILVPGICQERNLVSTVS